MAAARKIFIHSPELDSGGYPEDCPFNTSRAGRTRATIESMGLLTGTDRREVVPLALTDEELRSFHSASYLDALRRAGSGDLSPYEALQAGLGTPDTPIFKDMFSYVALAAGASVAAAQLILDGEASVAFNPSGGYHHAQPDHAAGFCFLNDIVLAALTLRQAGKRVLFLDIDVHHSDGVQEAFYACPDVMTMSLHESGRTLFPGTGYSGEIGEGEGMGYNLNIPLPVGTYDQIYEEAFAQAVLPVMKAYNPDVIILELGMDALAGDPLAHLHLTNNVHAHIVEDVLNLGKPILATGGGGYNVENTVRGWALCWSVLCGDHSRHDVGVGMGGVMLENTDWLGGLRDRMLLSDAGRREGIDAEVRSGIDAIRQTVFPVHGL